MRAYMALSSTCSIMDISHSTAFLWRWFIRAVCFECWIDFVIAKDLLSDLRLLFMSLSSFLSALLIRLFIFKYLFLRLFLSSWLVKLVWKADQLKNSRANIESKENEMAGFEVRTSCLHCTICYELMAFFLFICALFFPHFTWIFCVYLNATATAKQTSLRWYFKHKDLVKSLHLASNYRSFWRTVF